MPCTPSALVLAKLMPTTLPEASSNAPPLLPELIAASVIIKLSNVTLSTVIERFNALIMPDVTDCPFPSALPIATTSCPNTTLSESPNSAIAI